jgi:hypothetical protein
MHVIEDLKSKIVNPQQQLVIDDDDLERPLMSTIYATVRRGSEKKGIKSRKAEIKNVQKKQNKI